MTEAHDLFATMPAADREEFVKQLRAWEPSLTPALIAEAVTFDGN